MNLSRWIYIGVIILFGSSCKQPKQALPYLGNPIEVTPGDTVYPTIPDFGFLDQDSQLVHLSTFDRKIFVADFIFLSCPSICPKMNQEMFRVYKTFLSDDRVAFISHSIDSERDTVTALRNYTNLMGIQSNKWHFVTGTGDSTQRMAENAYYSIAYPDSTAPGGFTHSGGLLLIDLSRHIRGVYNGTKPEETDRLIRDIKVLLDEKKLN